MTQSSGGFRYPLRGASSYLLPGSGAFPPRIRIDTHLLGERTGLLYLRRQFRSETREVVLETPVESIRMVLPPEGRPEDWEIALTDFLDTGFPALLSGRLSRIVARAEEPEARGGADAPVEGTET